MLAKLLKYDFKAMFKIFLPLWGVLLVVSGINRLFSGAGLDAEQGLGLVNSLMVLLYVLLIMAVMVVTTVIMVCLTLFINKTKAGSAMRAVSEDRGAAELMGINVNRTISMTFAIGSALAAVAGILYICQYQSLRPTLGALPGIKAFVAAVLGGIGSVPGAMLGGIVLGLIESMAKAYISTELADAIVFGVLVVVLLVRPAGLLGKKTLVKV